MMSLKIFHYKKFLKNEFIRKLKEKNKNQFKTSKLKKYKNLSQIILLLCFLIKQNL